MKLKFLLCLFFLPFAQLLRADDLRGDTIDIRNYLLKLDLRDFETRVLHGSATIGIKAKLNDVEGINLDLLRLKVDSVLVNGRPGAFTYNDSLLHIPFSKALSRGDSATLVVYYHGRPGVLTGDFGGFYWDDEYAFNIGVSFVSNPHNYGRVWFPCFDNFKVRSYFEYFITTRATDKAFCNGILLGEKTEDSARVWHWKLKEDIPSYLASVAVAGYITLQDTVHGINGVIPVEIAVRAKDSALLKQRFEHLHPAFHLMEHYWGPYRWERVGYCMVPFQEGAMEHATNIAFMRNYLDLYAKECEITMVHELSHHWFGNLVTCDSAADMWLNEGWATYSQSLFIEGLYGRDSARQYRRESHMTELQITHVSDGGYLPVSCVPSKQTYGSTVYQKGSDVVHTLRYYLGDSLFFNGVKGYLNHYAFKTASTLQLRNYLSGYSGRDLTDFFNDWVLAPGYPHFSICDKYVSRVNGRYEVYINIRQQLSHAPGYYKQVPVTVSYFDRNMRRKDELVLIDGACTTYATMLDFKPEFIALDFDENLAEAISDEWHIVRDSGLYDFSGALMSVQVHAVKDSSLIRVAHNWIPAEAMIHSVRGLHMHNSRYWTVDGVFDPGMKATGIFNYSAMAADHLDNNFITNEDSLVMMYRTDPSAEWKPADNFLVDKGDNDSDRVGVVIVYPLKKGEYAIAVYNSQLPDEARKASDCEQIHGIIKAGNDFKVSFDKLTKMLVIAFGKNIFERAEVCDVQGRKIMEQKITDTENKLSVKLSHVSDGSYIVTLTLKTGRKISKKLINQ